MWEGLFAFRISTAQGSAELSRCSVGKRAMRSFAVVQPGYKTPIKLAFAKYSTAGIHGLGKVRLFEATRVEVVVGFCAAGRTI